MPVAFAAIYIANRPDQPIPNDDAELVLNDRAIETASGGVPRPYSDTTQKRRPARTEADLERQRDLASRIGRVSRLPDDKNPATMSVAEAAKTKQSPGRVTAMMPPDRFDRRAYESDPDTYLSVHEPARVWQTAEPSPEVPVLKSVGAKNHNVAQGESVRLQVKTAPNMPVTFTSFDLGAFPNGLTSISVGANADGVAEAVLHASKGTIGEVNVLAGSPAAAEHVKFRVFVRMPRPGVTQ